MGINCQTFNMFGDFKLKPIFIRRQIPLASMHKTAIPRQYFGFGGTEEWRIQGAVTWMPGNAGKPGNHAENRTPPQNEQYQQNS